MKKKFSLSLIIAIMLLLVILITGCNTEEHIKSTGYHPIVIGGVLIGGSSESIWLQSSEVAEHIEGNEDYSIYSQNKYLGKANGGEVYISQASGCERIDISYSEEFNLDIVALQCDWNAIPRTIIEEDTNASKYVDKVAEILASYGLKDASVNIKQSIKTDLDGDGTDEVIISAENIISNVVDENGNMFVEGLLECKKDTYSIVVLFREIDNELEYSMIQQSIYTDEERIKNECPEVWDIKSVIDLDGNRKMELVTGYRYYEGYGYIVYEVNADEVKVVLTNGDGA